MKLLLALSVFVSAGYLSGQSLSPQIIDCADTSEIIKQPDEMPEYPGGVAAMYKYIASNIELPECMREQGLGMGKLFVQFIIEKDGAVCNVKFLKKPVSCGNFEDEIKNIIRKLKFKPGTQAGKPIRVAFQMPIQICFK